MDIEIKWKHPQGDWRCFDINDILHMPVEHSCWLFSNSKIPVVVKQDDCYIVNTDELKNKYRKTGKRCFNFKTLLTASSMLKRPLWEAGFVQRDN